LAGIFTSNNGIITITCYVSIADHSWFKENAKIKLMIIVGKVAALLEIPNTLTAVINTCYALFFCICL